MTWLGMVETIDEETIRGSVSVESPEVDFVLILPVAAFIDVDDEGTGAALQVFTPG